MNAVFRDFSQQHNALIKRFVSYTQLVFQKEFDDISISLFEILALFDWEIKDYLMWTAERKAS